MGTVHKLVFRVVGESRWDIMEEQFGLSTAIEKSEKALEKVIFEFEASCLREKKLVEQNQRLQREIAALNAKMDRVDFEAWTQKQNLTRDIKDLENHIKAIDKGFVLPSSQPEPN